MKRALKEKLTIAQNILLETVDIAKDVHYFINRPPWFLRNNNRTKKSNFKTIYDTIYRLQNEGFLKEVENQGRKKYITTLKGKAKILAYLKIDKKWDNKWRIVIFDIPEKKRIMRNKFRDKLILIGYRQLQESVWICPYNTADVVEELIILYDAEEYIHYLLVEEIDNRDVLTKLFNLDKE